MRQWLFLETQAEAPILSNLNYLLYISGTVRCPAVAPFLTNNLCHFFQSNSSDAQQNVQLSYSRQFTAVPTHPGFEDLCHLPKITIQSVTYPTTSKHQAELMDMKTLTAPIGGAGRLLSRAPSPTKPLGLTHTQSCRFPNASARQKGVTGDYGVPRED